MAVDEVLLEAAQRIGQPVLRFYGWTEPAGTFGYFQKYVEAASWTPLRPLIRRPTGGGLVPHDRDWTYSLVFPPGHRWHALRARESYQRVHEWLHAAFAALGVTTRLAPCRRPEGSGRCFLGAEKFDLLWEGRKIAGAAQRRNRDGLLIQGSVQPPQELKGRSDWEESMRAGVPDFGAVRWFALEWNEKLSRRVDELARDKYSQIGYNQRR